MENWNKLEFIFAFKLGIPPNVLDNLEYYRIHFLFTEYEAHVKRENEEYEKQNKSKGSTSQMPQMPRMQVPNFGNYKLPKPPSYH